MHVLHEDNHLLVVSKPPGLVTQGATPGEPSLVHEAKAYLKRKYHKPGNVYLGVVSRLDAVTSGVVVLARTSKGAERLSRQFRERHTTKIYWALVEGQPPPQGALSDWLAKDEAAQRMTVAAPESPGAQWAELRFRRRKRIAGGAWLEVELLTGRKHQIRVQLAARGWPVWGDHKYGSRQHFPAGIALHARALAFDHPITKERLTLLAPPPASWGPPRNFAGGDENAS